MVGLVKMSTVTKDTLLPSKELVRNVLSTLDHKIVERYAIQINASKIKR